MAKAKKIEEVMVVSVSSGDAFCPKSTDEKIRAAFQIKPSPKNMVFPTPSGEISVSRESKKGAQAKWFSVDEHGRKYEGSKKAVRENVAELVTIAHRQAKMKLEKKIGTIQETLQAT